MNKRYRLLARLLPCGLAVLLAGCAAKPPVEVWQQEFEAYEAQQPAGANLLAEGALRRASPDDRPARQGFAVRHVLRPAGLLPEDCDVAAELVGIADVDGDLCYVFMVAVLGQGAAPGDVEAIRAMLPAAWCLCDDQARWLTGADDESARARYVSTRQATLADETAHSLFPGRTDRFRADVHAREITIREAHSNAVWRLATASFAAGSGQ